MLQFFIGYSSITKSVVVEDVVSSVSFVLDINYLGLSDVEVLAFETSETTPVTYTNVSKEEMEVRLGSQDIPMILNTTPSVYQPNKVVVRVMHVSTFEVLINEMLK